jgi:hypothetical protein
MHTGSRWRQLGRQGRPLTGPFLGQRRVAAGDEPFAGVVRVGDLDQVGLVALAATEAQLEKILAAVRAGRLTDSGTIGIRVGKVIGRYKMTGSRRGGRTASRRRRRG